MARSPGIPRPSRPRTVKVQFNALRGEFEALHAQMQSPKSRSAVRQLLSAPAIDLNLAAALKKSGPP